MKIPNLKRARQRGLAWFLVGLIILLVAVVVIWVAVQIINAAQHVFSHWHEPPPNIGLYGGDGVDPRGLFNRPYDPTMTQQLMMMVITNIQSPDGTNVLFPLAVLAGNGPVGPWDTLICGTNWFGNPTNLAGFVNSLKDASNALYWRGLDPQSNATSRFYNVTRMDNGTNGPLDFTPGPINTATVVRGSMALPAPRLPRLLEAK